MEGIALKPIRVRSTGQEYLPGDRVEAEPAKLLQWSEKGLVRIVEEFTAPPSCPDQVPGLATPTQRPKTGLKAANPGHCRSCESFSPDPERGRLGLGYCQVKNHYLWIADTSGCVEYRAKEASGIPVPKFSIGDRVTFLFRDSLTTREGIIEDLQFNWSTGWWYRIETDGKKIWAAEVHIAGRAEG